MNGRQGGVKGDRSYNTDLNKTIRRKERKIK